MFNIFYVLLIPVLVLTKSTKIFHRVILYYGITGGLNLRSVYMFTSAPFMSTFAEVDNYVRTKLYH